MGLSLKGIGRGLKKIGKKVGGVVSKSAPFAGLIPGVGPLAAGVLGAGGAALSGKNLKDILKSGLSSGGGAFLGGKLAGVAKGALGSLGSKVPEVLRGGVPAQVGDLITGGGARTASSAAGGGGWMDTVKRAGGSVFDYAKKNPELILGGIGAIQSARSSAAADKMYDQGLGDIRGAYSAKAPLRSMALKQLMDPRLRDLSHIFKARGNPMAA